MLNIIRLELHKRIGSHNINTKDVANNILEKIEQYGMLPPIRHNIAQGKDEAIMGLKWETEDE